MLPARLTSLLQALSRPEVRAQLATGAVLLLDADLSRIAFANAAARRLLALAPGAPGLADASPAARQIRSAARLLAQTGAARVMLRPATGLAARPLAADLTHLCGEPPLVLLAVSHAPGAAEPEPSDFAFEAGEAAILFDENGFARSDAGRDAPPLAAEVQAFIASGADRASVALLGRTVELARLSDRRVLALLGPEEAEPVLAKEEDAQPSALTERTFHALSIASIVRRWHTRQDDDEEDAPIPSTDPKDAPVLDDAPTLADAALPEVAAEAVAAVPAPLAAVLPLPLRSLWGLPPPLAPDATEAEVRDADDGHAEEPGRQDVPDEAPCPSALADAPGEDAPARPAAGGEPPPGSVEAGAEAPGVARFEAAPARFVWQIDEEGRFRSLSPEFAAAVGPAVAEVVGLHFAEVAACLGFDAGGEIQRLLERRDTWSGRTVLWPVEGTGRRAPVDLAALPVYGRDRRFEGFRGFGIVRMSEHVADETGYAPLPRPGAAETEAPPAADDGPAAGPTLRLHTFEAGEAPTFGRRAEPPPAEDDTPKVIRLEERRRPRETLSQAEEAAFRAIGMKLADRSEAESPGALRFEPATPENEGDNAPVLPEEPAVEAPAEPVETAAADVRPEPADEAPAALPADPETLLAALPMPLLVRSDDRLVFANQALLDLGGHADLAALESAGGLEALFPEAQAPAGAGEMTVRRAGGGETAMRVHLQRIAFRGRSSLLMTFTPADAVPAPGIASDLRHEVEELRAVLDTATDGIVLLDPAGAVRSMNGSAHALFGVGPEEVQGRPLVGLFAHESQKTILDYLETLKETGLAGILNDGREVIGRVAQGGFIPLFITVGRLSADRGSCVVIRDITHWKRIEEDLVNARRQAEAASLHKSRFLANISHELRTPLNAIIGFADVMATECFGPIGNERYIEYLGDIKRSGHHVLDLVNDLLDISKIEAGKLELTFEAVSLNEVLAEVVALMQPQANRERVIVRSNLPASVPPVVADRRTIRQIALNLVSNAIRFTPAGGQIIASTTYTAEGTVLMRFRDSGIGMTEREIEIALTPFQQVQPAATQERGAGTGLGLPLTKAMAEANRASFDIQSAPGEGTLVEIAFPAQRVLAD